MKALISVYLREKSIIVAPRGGGGGVTYETEPVLLSPPEADPVQEAAVQSLQSSTEHMGKHIYDFRNVKNPVLEKLKIKSLKKFYQDIALCWVYREQQGLFIQPWCPVKNGKGFTLAGSPLPVEDETRLGEAILQTLHEAEKMNPAP